MSVIFEWDDGYGNRVFTETFVRPKTSSTGFDQIKPLSDKIQIGQTAFQRLEPDMQARLQAEFNSSNGTSSSVVFYREYLQNNSLGKRFQELKQKNTPTK